MGAFDCALDVATSTLSRSNGQQIIPLAVGASKIEQNVVLRRNCPHRDGSSPTLVQCGLPCGVSQGVNCLPRLTQEAAPFARMPEKNPVENHRVFP